MGAKTILVVESNDQRAGFYIAAISDRGYAACRVRTARAAFNRLRRHPYDSVCLFGAEVSVEIALPVLQQLLDED
jgi:DNA-binding response OmpR family regulator